jgi:Tol biopolymer transport system component
MRIAAVIALGVAVVGLLAVLPNQRGEAAWPGGNGRILYADFADGAGGIWVMDIDGGNRELLTDGNDTFPSWSPNGERIAFQRGVYAVGGEGAAPQAFSSSIYVMNADGTNQQAIAFGGMPSWSPDGSKIIFSREGDILQTDADGSNEETITGGDNFLDTYPVYRPGSSNEIAMLRTELSGGAGLGPAGFVPPEVVVLNLNTHVATNVSNSSGYYDGAPDWSPDGSALIYRGPGGDIYSWSYSMPPDPAQSILDGSGVVLDAPSFSPDGARIAYTSGPPIVSLGEPGIQGTPSASQIVWLMNATGTNPVQIPGSVTEPYEIAPDWEPTGVATHTPTDTPSPSPSPTPSPTPTPAGPTPIEDDLIWGDHQCDGEANPIDALLVLRHDAGLTVNAGDCPPLGTGIEVLSVGAAGLGEGDGDPQVWGNVDCDAEISPIDSLKILRYDAGLSVSQEVGCPPIGSDVTVQYDS